MIAEGIVADRIPMELLQSLYHGAIPFNFGRNKFYLKAWLERLHNTGFGPKLMQKRHGNCGRLDDDDSKSFENFEMASMSMQLGSITSARL